MTAAKEHVPEEEFESFQKGITDVNTLTKMGPSNRPELELQKSQSYNEEDSINGFSPTPNHFYKKGGRICELDKRIK